MYQNQIIDQKGDFLRDKLDWASRDELYACAKRHGIKEIDEAMYMGGYAAEKMKRILREKGIKDVKTTIQLFAEKPAEQSKGMSLDDLINTPVNQPVMTRAELAKECKKRGIKMARTDTKEQLLERLNVQTTA